MNIKKNDKIKLTITALSAEGFGIGRIDGFCIFVPNAIEGDIIAAHIVKVLKKFAFAKIDEIITPHLTVLSLNAEFSGSAAAAPISKCNMTRNASPSTGALRTLSGVSVIFLPRFRRSSPPTRPIFTETKRNTLCREIRTALKSAFTLRTVIGL